MATEIGGFTVDDLRHRMLAEELVAWAAYFEIIHEAEQEAIAKSRAEAKRNSDQPRSPTKKPGMGGR